MLVTSIADLGAYIRQERRRQRLTQNELAGLSGVGLTFISQLENGKATAEVGKVFNVLSVLGSDLIVERRR